MLYDVEDVSADLQTILDAMDEDGDGAVTLDELVAYDAKFPQLLMPAFKTQKAMQKRVFGKRFWKKAALWRAATYGERQMLENVLMQKRRRDRRIAEEKSKEEERVRLEKEKAERAQKREEARLKKLADEEHMKKLRESETPEEREQREASENLENWIQRWRQYEKEKSEKSEEEKGNGIDRTIDVGGGQNEIKEGLESKEDDSQFRQQDLLDIRKGLRSGGNRLILAIARCFKSHRDRDIALKTEEIQTMVRFDQLDPERRLSYILSPLPCTIETSYKPNKRSAHSPPPSFLKQAQPPCHTHFDLLPSSPLYCFLSLPPPLRLPGGTFLYGQRGKEAPREGHERDLAEGQVRFSFSHGGPEESCAEAGED